ncbi:hypothetical protein EIN_097130 [Entamoeba invadens IP1]|uniref:SGNH hydrolase-type esterase domain-containing protein n=1 Tax=Entamoeba invadens IP1 TaxID=370355 RepID=A0A0A1U6K9_ENTIV|nr:hypothetical protein EIN_097130 [Entamoeba invadens IP1]ELP87446.1 hypothetical protein EIN_097130 [Entamoeba invadens IP1]|eukprot:XP_004254217.1 hypothetical protein EIN_097130 [Entamoeba invadens IP1]
MTVVYMFGDSNLFGMQAVTMTQYPREDIFHSIVIKELKKMGNVEYKVDGMPGRSIEREDTVFGIFSGEKVFMAFLKSFSRIETTKKKIFVFSLCVNDILAGATAEETISSIKMCLKRIKETSNSKTILVIPPSIKECTFQPWAEITQRGREQSIILTQILLKRSLDNVDAYADFSDLQVGEDGVHLTKESHKKAAKKVLDSIRSLNF